MVGEGCAANDVLLQPEFPSEGGQLSGGDFRIKQNIPTGHFRESNNKRQFAMM